MSSVKNLKRIFSTDRLDFEKGDEAVRTILGEMADEALVTICF